MYVFCVVNGMCVNTYAITTIQCVWYVHWLCSHYILYFWLCIFAYAIQGYDMEDAMILNKASHERGFAHATVYKSEVCQYRVL